MNFLTIWTCQHSFVTERKRPSAEGHFIGRRFTRGVGVERRPSFPVTLSSCFAPAVIWI